MLRAQFYFYHVFLVENQSAIIHNASIDYYTDTSFGNALWFNAALTISIVLNA
jgi:hypothetical protein